MASMKRMPYAMAGVVGCLLLIAPGCASTRQFVPTPNYSDVSDTTVHIALTRPSIMGSALAFEVVDTGKTIGNIGPYGTLTWERKAGKMNMSAQPKLLFMGKYNPMDLELEGPQRYTFSVGVPFWYPFDRNAIRLVSVTPLNVTRAGRNEPEYMPPARPTPGSNTVGLDQHPHRGATAAILTFDARAGLSVDEVALLADRFAVELDRTDVYKLVPRSKMKEIMDFQAYSATCGGVECAVEAGQQLGVEYIIYGSIGRIGSMFTMNVYIASVEKGAVVAGTTVDFQGKIEGLLTEGMARAVESLLQAVSKKAD